MITCPKCATNYNLDARATDGGQLQCTRCKHQWRLSDKTGSTVKPVEKTVRRIVLRPARKPDASPTAGETTLTTGDTKSKESMNQDATAITDSKPTVSEAHLETPAAEYKNPKRRFGEKWLNIAAVFGAILIFGGGLVLRDRVVSVIPGMSTLYKLAGIDINQTSLEFLAVKTRTELVNHGEILVVEGVIKNTGDEAITLPAVRLAMRSRNKREVHSWHHQPQQKKIAAGEAISFSTRLNNPPESTHDIQLKFVEQHQRKAELN